MKKDYIRDYVTEMFRKYAVAPKLQRNELTSAEICDITAVEKTLSELERDCKNHIVEAVSAVYLKDADKPLRKNDISNRVHSFSISFPASEALVYRWLRYARRVCAEMRGLSVPKYDSSRGHDNDKI